MRFEQKKTFMFCVLSRTVHFWFVFLFVDGDFFPLGTRTLLLVPHLCQIEKTLNSIDQRRIEGPSK